MLSTGESCHGALSEMPYIHYPHSLVRSGTIVLAIPANSQIPNCSMMMGKSTHEDRLSHTEGKRLISILRHERDALCHCLLPEFRKRSPKECDRTLLQRNNLSQQLQER